MAQSYRAGGTIDDRCRPCKVLRRHTVLVVDGSGTPLRVICDTCGSQHNYRGGEKPEPVRSRSAAPAASHEPLPIVSERESSGESIQLEGLEMTDDLELLLRRIIREEAGLTPSVPADKWRGGELVLRPGREGLQEKSLPIETFFHKIVMLRNRLRVLEQQVNGAEIPQELKIKLQGYITTCYGSLTSFNVLFADEQDRFSGSGRD
jgi:hypothetical protein